MLSRLGYYVRLLCRGVPSRTMKEVESAINGNMATLTYDNLEEWAERLLDRFKQVFAQESFSLICAAICLCIISLCSM